MRHAQQILAHDPTARTAVHLPDDRFIPLRPRELCASICCDTREFGPQAGFLMRVFDEMEELFEREAIRLEHELIEYYVAFNPDRETVPLPLDPPGSFRHCEVPEMLERLAYLFGKANFEQLDPAQVQEVVDYGGRRGLRVYLRPERVQHLSVWVRGRGETRQRLRTARHPFRGEYRTVPMYRRLAIVAQLRDEPNLLLKLFKDIPMSDVEALLPHAEVRMSWLDRALALSGGYGTAGTTAFKVFSALTGALYLSKLLWIVLGGMVMLLYQGIMGYRRARTSRDAHRTRHLYFQNLDNNAGVIHSLVASIAQEDLKEALLAYAFCLSATPRIVSEGDLARRVERLLRERFAIQVHFDVADALETLERLGLYTDRAAFRVVEPAGAVIRLNDQIERRRAGLYEGSINAGAVTQPPRG